MSKPIIITTRKSRLALVQAELAKSACEASFPAAEVSLLKVVTTGDRRQAWSLEKQGGKGLFTKELENALLEGKADLAVHSAKDLPTENPEGLAIVGFLPRADVHDVLVRRKASESIRKLATGSPRRRAQSALFLPGLEYDEIRGNVETRLNKIREGYADATVMARAGLKRLGIEAWEGLELETLQLTQMIPAVGQGAIALQCRVEDVERFFILDDAPTAQAVRIERQFLSSVGGGCQTAFAAHFTEGKLYCFHEEHGRFTITFENLEPDTVQAAIDKSLEGLK